MNGDIDRDLRDVLEQLSHDGLLRDTALDGAVAGADFGSNDYLGLARDPEVVDAMCAAAREFGAGGRSARLLKGGSPLHEQAERAAAEWLGAEAALLFPSGYQANVGLLQSVATRGDVVISDRLNHASLIDAMSLSRAQVLVHEHCDLADIERCLQQSANAKRRIVVTEGVFSMDGDAAPLADIDELCRRYDAWLIVDEAHSAGVLGPQGAGAWAACGAQGAHRLLARVVTGGKALGLAGAFVVGSRALRDVVIHKARSFMFTTAPPPALAGGLVAAVQRCREADDRRAAVTKNARDLAERLRLPHPDAAVVPFPVGDAERAVALARTLTEAGFYAPAVRPPTVPEGRSQLRIVCHADQSPEQLTKLVELLLQQPALPAPPSKAAMARTTFVVGTDTGVGKTVVSGVLLRYLQQHGAARYWKPVQTGDDDDTATVAELAAAAPETLLGNYAYYELPASPHEAAAHEGKSVDVAGLRQQLRTHREQDVDRDLLIEFAGGLHVPYSMEPYFAQVELLRRRDRVVLVARSGLGTLNHTLLSVEALRARGIGVRALFLVGEPHPSNSATLRAVAGCEHVFELPMLASLTTAAIDAWLAANDLREVFADE